MPSYSDVLFAKLALNQGLVAPPHLQESLSALEASQRAGVRQTIGQVLLKRGYLTHYAARQLETARKLAERSRRAKLTVQLLLRHGRPEESLLKSYYETLKHEGFPCQLGEKLVGEGRISAQENEALTQAIDRAWDALYQRELRELSDGLRYRLAQIGGGSGGYGYGNPSVYAMPAYPHNATGMHPAYGATGIHPAGGQTGVRQAYVHPQAYAAQPGYQQMYTGTRAAQPAWGSGAYAQPGSGGYPQQPGPGGYGPPAAQAQMAPANNPLPPSPSPYATGHRQAYMPQAPMPPGGQVANTAEQMAHMHLLPNWALTRERPSYHPGAEQPPHAAPHKAEGKQRNNRKLREPTGTVPGYEYVERLGTGKTGIVYKAKQLSSGRTVALKVMLPVFQEDPNLCQRFLRETKEAARRRNEHLREVYESGQRGGLLFMAMEYVEGETLEDKIDRAGKLAESDVLRWIAQIARG
ncbi:MAG: protein kinase domain-containing protein, partial [Planctomycetota bacterium]